MVGFVSVPIKTYVSVIQSTHIVKTQAYQRVTVAKDFMVNQVKDVPTAVISAMNQLAQIVPVVIGTE